jgi:hypothetical protein
LILAPATVHVCFADVVQPVIQVLPDLQAGAQMLKVSWKTPLAEVNWPGGVTVNPPRLHEFGLPADIASENAILLAIA